MILSAFGPGVPLLIYLTLGERSTAQLTHLRVWTTAHNTAITITALLIIGAKFIGDGITSLT